MRRNTGIVKVLLHFSEMNVEALVNWVGEEIKILSTNPYTKLIATTQTFTKLPDCLNDLTEIRRKRETDKSKHLSFKEQGYVNSILNAFTGIAKQVETLANDKARGDEPVVRIIIERLGFKARGTKDGGRGAKDEKILSERKRALQTWQLNSAPVTIYSEQ